MASEEAKVVENRSEDKEGTISDSKEESADVSAKISNNECIEGEEQDARKSISCTTEDSSDAAIEEQKEGTGEVVDTEVTKSECVAEQPSECEERPAATSADKEKRNSEQKKVTEKRRQGKRSGKGALMKQLAVLNIPDGIILVKDKRYTGYHCTFCNCVLKSLATMKAHVGGKWHKRTLHMRIVNDKRKKIASSSKSSGSAVQKVLPKEPLKSSLEEFLSTTKARIVGLSYIIETQRPNKEPTFQCNLCEVSCDSSDIKDHIMGMKHCLMYSKLVKPGKLAELLAKQLTKAEKNKEIAKLSEELERENGRGEITVKFLPAKSAAGRKPSNLQQRRRSGNRPFDRSRTSGNKPASRASDQRNRNSRITKRNTQKPQQKRKRDVMNLAKKRQLLEREFQDRMQYTMPGAQRSSFSGGWAMGNKTMDMFPYKRDAGFYPNYSNFYRDSYGERSFNRQYLNEPYEQMGQFNSREMYHREKYDSRQSFWSDQHENFTSNKPQSYNNRSASSAYHEGYSRDSHAQVSALKHLAGINVTSEEDAGVVINAINSLTNSVMNYKLRDLSQPVQQASSRKDQWLLQKSLKSNDLTSLLDLPDKNSAGSARDRYGGRSSQMNRDWGINQIAKPKNWLF